MNCIKNKNVVVIIVDDQLNISESSASSRYKTYKKCLDRVKESLKHKWDLDFYFCQNSCDVAKVELQAGQPKLALIDMVLDEPWSSSSIARLDKQLIKERWPMILISARFDSSEAIGRVNRLTDNSTDAVFQFLMWSAIEKAANGFEADELASIINFILSSSKSQDLRFNKGLKDPINILHITDPHFGKAKWDVGKLMTLKVECDNAKLDVADFLAITGDITDQSTPSEYKLALDFFYALAEHQIVAKTEIGLPKDRVFLCPGNHDFSHRLALSANILEDKKTFKIENNIVDPWSRNYAWIPYERFEAEIAGHKDSWIPSPGYRINSRFKNAGIIILELNVEKYKIGSYQEGLSADQLRDSMNTAVSEVSKLRQEHECLIILSHRYESDSWRELAQIIDSTFLGLCSGGPVILLCGHEHTDDVSTKLDDKALFIRGIPPIPGALRPDDVLPVVHMLSLLREGGVVTGAKIYSFHQESSRWLVKSGGGKHYEYNSDTGRWCRQ